MQMAQAIRGNYNALMWLQPELQQSLSIALKAMNRYVDEESPDSALSDCIQALYQVQGSLEMVNMAGAAMLTGEMLHTAMALRAANISNVVSTQEALIRALLLLPNYLKLLSDDFPDHPLCILDSINELRLTRDESAISEISLFNPSLSIVLPDSIMPRPQRQLPATTLEPHQLGHAFQRLLLNWLRQQDNDSLRKMRSLVHYLRLSSLEEKTTLLWWVAECVLDALENNGLVTNSEIKTLLGKLITPIKQQSEHSEAELLINFPTGLVAQLLLHTAKSQNQSPHITLIKTTFGLHCFDQKQKIYGMSNNALGDAHIALLSQLHDLELRIDEYSANEVADASQIQAVIEELQSMADTLALLREYEASNLLHHQIDQLHVVIANNARPDTALLTELADDLLKVETFLQASTQSNVNVQLRNKVITECLLEMANIKETLTLMSKSGRNPADLGDTTAQLTLIAGSLSMLNYSDAADVVAKTADKISPQLETGSAFNPAQFNHLADILACCDIYMEGIRQHGHAEAEYLTEALDKLANFDAIDESANSDLFVPDETTSSVVYPAIDEIDALLSDAPTPLLFDTASATSSQPVASQTNAVSDAEIDWIFADNLDTEIATVFVEEALAVLADLEQLIPQWLEQQNTQVIADIRRLFHTLKGSGRMAGAMVIGELAWSVEQALNHLLDGTRPASTVVEQLTLQGFELMPALLARFTSANMDSCAEVEILHTLKQRYLDEKITSAQISNEPIITQTGVERYIQQRQSDTLLTGVARYIQQLETQTGVDRYLRQQHPSHITEKQPQSAALTSVERYLLQQQRQQQPSTSVDRYLAQLAMLAENEAEQGELLQIYNAEASQHIVSLQQGINEIHFSRQITKELMRSAHSLKGCANIANMRPMAAVATELDRVMKRLHAQSTVLGSEQIVLLSDIINDLKQLQLNHHHTPHDPVIDELTEKLAQLLPADDDETQTPVIDPEFLLVLLEETDELLERYTQQLALWQHAPEQSDNLNALQQTLAKLTETASQAQQRVLANLYQALAELILNSHPRMAGLDNLLNQGYEELNQHIEQLLQNQPLKEQGFTDNVTAFLSAANVSAQWEDDEFSFAIPADNDTEVLEAFTEEAEQLLRSMGRIIKDWRHHFTTEDDANQLHRDLHTLKGGARLAGITPIADLTHQLESLVLAASDKQINADDDMFDLLQRCQDKLTEMQEQLAARHRIATADSLIAEMMLLLHPDMTPASETGIRPKVEHIQLDSTLLSEAEQEDIVSTKAVSSAPAHNEHIRVRADLLDDLTNYAGEVSISRDRIIQQHGSMRQQLREFETTVVRLHDQLRKLEIETETQILFRYDDEKRKQDADFDPLELDRFSMIQQLSRGLTESVIDLQDISRTMNNVMRETDVTLLQQSRLNTDLQQGLMNTRLLPFNQVVPRLERIVRQTAAELNKRVELTVHGAELELDRTVLDRLIAPVEHLLRNAIAHGIESADERQRLTKPEQGQLRIDVSREGTEIVLLLQDDGQGINIEKIREKAIQSGLIEAHRQPSDNALIELIMTSGFTTADSLSQLAGRGVGMDVVNQEVRDLNGRLTIDSKTGHGARFEIRLPLTLSVVQALLIRIQNEQYAIPLGTVSAGERLSVSDIKTLLSQPEPSYEFNGEQYRFMPLVRLLDKPLQLPVNEKLQLPLLLLRSGTTRIALLVDAILSNREIVIKPVGAQLAAITAINGATVLGDGQVVFILDLPALIDSSPIQLTQAPVLSSSDDADSDRTPVAMIVDDSITMRKASGNLLKRLGFEVMTARDGVDALSQLHEQKPDIILLDIEMPHMDGFEFASIVRNDPDFQSLPIIMITSRTGEKHRERASRIGVNAYLGKPYLEAELIDNMQRLLAKPFITKPGT